MYIDMPTGDSIFTDTKRQFIFVILSFIVSIIYLKKNWYEYWGLLMMCVSFILFIIFTMASRTTLLTSLVVVFQGILTWDTFPEFIWNNKDLILSFLVFIPFILILISIIIHLFVSTAIVRKKHEGNITGNHTKDNEFRRRSFQLTDSGFFTAFELSKYKEYASFRISFDLIITAFSSLILFVYSSQFASMVGFQPITYEEYNNIRVKTNTDKFWFGGQIGWLSVTWLASSILGAISVRNTGEGLKLYRRMRE
jgi:hypothetical protein